MNEILGQEVTAIGVLGLFILLLVREVIIPLISRLKKEPHAEPNQIRIFEVLRDLRAQLARLEGEMAEQHLWHGADQLGSKKAEQQTSDMHGWQSPDNAGRQDWRGGRIIDMIQRQDARLADLHQAILNLTAAIEQSGKKP